MNIITNTTEVTLDTKPVRNKSAKPVFCITNGNVYASTIDASEGEKCLQSGVSAVCHGKLKTTNGKQFCFVKDMPNRILDISDTYKDLLKDADVYRKQEAERQAKEAHAQAVIQLEEKINQHKMMMIDMQKKLEEEQQMLAAMEKEFTI